ncbi:hypothetical protein GCM10010335_49580 [Streptomyces galbus]|nr:hypothetical protein GCM10010335_49580 [Streptomyces galbus]
MGEVRLREDLLLNTDSFCGPWVARPGETGRRVGRPGRTGRTQCSENGRSCVGAVGFLWERPWEEWQQTTLPVRSASES